MLHLLPLDLARGAQTYARALRESLDSSSVEHLTIALFEAEPSLLKPDVRLSAPNGLGRRIGLSPTALLTLRKALKGLKPDVVIAHGGESLKYAALVLPSGTKLVYHKVGTAAELLRNPLRRAFHRAIAHRADLVAGISREMAEEAVSLNHSAEDRTVCIPNGRDPHAYRHLANPGSSSPVRFIFVGHLTRTKRPEWFVQAIEELDRRAIDVRGTVVGDGPLMADLREGAPQRVRFLGSRDDVPRLLAQADVFLFTSMPEGEGLPGVLIEAGMAGLPIIATEVSGADTVVEDGVTGFVVPIDNFTLFVEKAEALARNPRLRSDMGAAARQRCTTHFTLSASVDAWRRELDKLIPIG